MGRRSCSSAGKEISWKISNAINSPAQCKAGTAMGTMHFSWKSWEEKCKMPLQWQLPSASPCCAEKRLHGQGQFKCSRLLSELKGGRASLSAAGHGVWLCSPCLALIHLKAAGNTKPCYRFQELRQHQRKLLKWGKPGPSFHPLSSLPSAVLWG